MRNIYILPMHSRSKVKKMDDEKGLRGLFGEHGEEKDVWMSPYDSLIFVPRAGRYMIHRDDVEGFKSRCERVGMITRHIGFSVSGKSEKLFVAISDKKRYEEVLGRNSRYEKENMETFEKRRQADHTLEGLFASKIETESNTKKRSNEGHTFQSLFV